MKEIWKDIRDYEGIYQVSNFGRIRSLDRINYAGRKWEGKILSPKKIKTGYFQIALHYNGFTKYFYYHRLVAEAFIPNPDNLLEVNHKDENKHNNFVFINEDGTVDLEKSNLEWCDRKYNANYGTIKERAAAARRREVLQYDLDWNLVKKWKSAREIERVLGFASGNIYSCCKRRKHFERQYSKGYYWRYA